MLDYFCFCSDNIFMDVHLSIIYSTIFYATSLSSHSVSVLTLRCCDFKTKQRKCPPLWSIMIMAIYNVHTAVMCLNSIKSLLVDTRLAFKDWNLQNSTSRGFSESDNCVYVFQLHAFSFLKAKSDPKRLPDGPLTILSVTVKINWLTVFPWRRDTYAIFGWWSKLLIKSWESLTMLLFLSLVGWKRFKLCLML